MDRLTPSETDLALIDQLFPLFTQLSDRLQYKDLPSWQSATPFPFQYYDTVVTDDLGASGTVMHLFKIMYFLVKNVPVFFTEDLVRDVIRLSFCYWVMRKHLSI